MPDLPASARKPIDYTPASLDVAACEAAAARATEALRSAEAARQAIERGPIEQGPVPADESGDPDPEIQAARAAELAAARAAEDKARLAVEVAEKTVAAVRERVARDWNGAAPVFHVKIADLHEKVRYESELTALAGPWPGDDDLADAVRQAIEQIEPENLEDCLAAIDLYEDRVLKGETIGRDERRAFDRVRRACDSHPVVARVLARREYRMSMGPLVAGRMFVIGWDNLPVPFKRVGGLIPLDVVAELPEQHFLAAGWVAVSHLILTENLRKN